MSGNLTDLNRQVVMFWKMIGGALFRQKSKMLMIAFTIALGAALSSAMLNTMLGVGDKVNQELKTYGANIVVMHKDASLLTSIYGVDTNKSVNTHCGFCAVSYRQRKIRTDGQRR